jgi:hypothetical protein
MINRLLITALASFAFAVRGHAENIVCPPQNEIADGFGKWTGDYSGSLDEVSLSRQFLGEQEGAIIRCKREIGSMQIMFQKILPSNPRGRRGPKHFIWKAERGNHMQA